MVLMPGLALCLYGCSPVDSGVDAQRSYVVRNIEELERFFSDRELIERYMAAREDYAKADERGERRVGLAREFRGWLRENLDYAVECFFGFGEGEGGD